jgi:cytochrome P450
VRRLDALIYTIIADRRAQQQSPSGPKRGGLLEKLMAARDDGEEGDGEGMSDQYLRDEMNTLIIAGAETTAISLAWVTSTLAQYPDIARQVAEESQRVLGPNRLPTAADYAQLKYTQAVVLEVLRIRPPAYMVGRCCADDVELAGYTLQAGTTILISPYVIHRDPAYWVQPDTFCPERFLTEDGEVVPGALSGMGPNGAYVPFGGGPRVCIGTGFAMMELVIVTAILLREYELAIPLGEEPTKPQALITLRPEGSVVDLDIRFRRAARRLSSDVTAI